MRKFLYYLIISTLALAANAQEMHVKQYNFTTFSKETKTVSKYLDERSSELAKKHPEYGVRTYNTRCNDCVELIDKRTIDSRQYINPYDPGNTFSQSSYFPLHYKNSNDDVWHTIDPRLRPDSTKRGVYIAANQPVPTKCDLNTKTTSINAEGFEFVFNKDLSAYFFDEGTAYTATEKGNYIYHTVGEEGLLVEDFWNGVNMRQIFREGEIETEYVINAPLQLPIDKGWMVIEDHFSLPEGFTIQEIAGGEHTEIGYKGNYTIKNPKGEDIITIEKPVYVDAKAWGMHGNYKLIKNGNDYNLQMFVPVSWLNNKDNTYPLFLDPVVFGNSKSGNFLYCNGCAHTGASLGFTTKPGSCNYQTRVIIPEDVQLTNAYVDLEYNLTYDNTCGVPTHEPAPYCTFSQVTMEVRCDSCGTTTGQLRCNPANPPYTGTCTTDSNLVKGAGPILVNDSVPNYLSCIRPSCSPDTLPFTLLDRDSICGDVCGYLCANGHMWQITIEACSISGFITQDKTHQCVGQPVTFTAHASCGVPPYHYIWAKQSNNTGQTTYDTIYGSPNYVVTPNSPDSIIVSCIIYDTCSYNFWATTSLNDTAASPPLANAGPGDTLCAGTGGTITLGGQGGNPTTIPPGKVVSWAGSPQTSPSWLSSTTAANPTVTIPPGNSGIGEFYYVLTTANPYCVATDTAYIYSDTTPKPVITANGPTTFCMGQSVSLSTTGNFKAYNWSNSGGTTNPITANQPGSYDVTVTDQNNCTGVSNIIQVKVLAAPPADAGPNVKVCQGGIVTIGGKPTSVNGATVVWTSSPPSAVNYLDSTTVFNPTVTIPPSAAGQFIFIVTVNDTAEPNCPSTASDTVNAFLSPVPVIDSSGPTRFCTGGSVVLSVTGNYTSFVWDNNAGTNSQIKVTQTGCYDVTVTDQNGCTGVSNTICVLTTAVPPFQVFPDTTIMFGDSVMLSTDANLSSASIDSFTWYPGISISCLVCDNPVVTPAVDQIYALIIYANGCSVSDSAIIHVLYPDNFFIPNAFTPNGDGVNDNFYIATQAGVKVLLFQVFDRLGEKVHDGLYPWDGSYRGKPAPPAVYTYIFKLELFGEEIPIFRKGSVNLIR